jgi:IS1 family transposase/transposase-like protein
MEIKITLECPRCQGTNITKNGHKKYKKKQNYRCNFCNRQFIGDHNLTYKGCHSDLTKKIRRMLVRGVGIRDIAYIEGISTTKVLSVLLNVFCQIVLKQKHYSKLEIDEFWTYVGRKQNKLWLLYAYCKDTGEIVCYVWGGRHLKTARKLKQKLSELDISYDTVYSDNWNSFIVVFGGSNHIVGKENTVGIEGNNCLLRHRIRRAFRRTCCFSKKLLNHFKAFELAFFYINYGFV